VNEQEDQLSLTNRTVMCRWEGEGGE